MASAARDLRYRRNYGSVDGSLARELDWAAREHELRHAGEAPHHQEQTFVREQPKEEAQTKTHVRVRERQQVSMVSVAGFGAVIAMAVVLLMSYINLTVLAADTVSLKSQLTALESEHAALSAQYEQMFDLATVREAAEAAGMSKPGSSQIYYIDLSDGDNAVVYQQTQPNVLSRVLTSVNHGIYTAVEYFK
jgi:cell division protein FtsB